MSQWYTRVTNTSHKIHINNQSLQDTSLYGMYRISFLAAGVNREIAAKMTRSDTRADKIVSLIFWGMSQQLELIILGKCSSYPKFQHTLLSHSC